MSEPDPAIFWSWFSEHADRYRLLDELTRESRLDEVEQALHAYHPGLYFEIGGDAAGPTELVLTAEGDKRLFAAVRRLVDAAPEIPGWRVIAFKQPGGFKFVLEYHGVRIDPGECWFQPLTAKGHPNILAVRVACPAYDPSVEDAVTAAVSLAVDTGLGEELAAERLHHIEVVAVPAKPRESGFLPLRELPRYLEWVQERGAG